MGGSSRRPHLRPCKLSPCRTSSAWLSSGQGSGQVLPPPTPRLLSEGLAFLVLPSRCCPPRLRRCPVSRPPGEGRVLRMHSASLFVMSLTPRGSWRCGSRAGCPGPESRPSHSRLPGLARTWEPPVLPPERPSHRPALSPSCTQAPCPCRGWCRWLRGGSEDPAHTSTGRWAPSTWQGQERPCWNQPRWKSLQVEDEVTALGTLTGRLPGQGGVPCSCRAGRL